MSHPRVTDHCVLRYLERVKGLDIEAVRQHIGKLCAGLTIATVVKAEGHSFVIRDHTVVTVRPSLPQNPRRVPRAKSEVRA